MLWAIPPELKGVRIVKSNQIKKGQPFTHRDGSRGRILRNLRPNNVIVDVEIESLFGPMTTGTMYVHDIASVDGERVELSPQHKKLSDAVRAWGF